MEESLGLKPDGLLLSKQFASKKSKTSKSQIFLKYW